MRIKRLFSVTVCFGSPFDEQHEIKIQCKDDVTARSKAIPQAVKVLNKSQDELYRSDKDSWTDGDEPLNKKEYRHATEKDVAYCEIHMIQEWV